MKIVCQLDKNGYYVGMTEADESPLENGVYLMPAGSVDAKEPVLKDGYRLKWSGSNFTYEEIPIKEPVAEFDKPILTYAELRKREYPPMADYLDGVVKGDQMQIDKYIADCLAVKAKYPTPF